MEDPVLEQGHRDGRVGQGLPGEGEPIHIIAYDGGTEVTDVLAAKKRIDIPSNERDAVFRYWREVGDESIQWFKASRDIAGASAYSRDLPPIGMVATFLEATVSKTKTVRNPITQKLLRGSILQQLKAKGFRETDADPDFLVFYRAVIVSKVSSSIKGRPSLGGRGAIYGYGREPWSYSAVDGYEQGTIVIDMVDPVSMRAVWRNAAQGEAALNPTIDRASEKIPENTRKPSRSANSR